MTTIRSAAFAVVYYVLSVAYVVMACVSLVLPGRRATGWIVRRYARRMVQALHVVAGIKVEVVGLHRVPAGACIIAAKHHSWFDGFCMYSQFDDLAFVTGSHLERYPLLSHVLKKLGAIVVDSCGGYKARASLARSAEIANAAGRRILIYPEGHLSAAGERHRYRTGVWHMYATFKVPVVPVATNLGLFAPQAHWRKHPGRATLRFMEPIAYDPALTKAEFMQRLEGRIESASSLLIARSRGGLHLLAPSVLAAADGGPGS